MNLVLDEVKEALTGMCPSAVSTRIHLTLCRRGRQHPVSQARPHCRTRHPPSRHLARGRKRRDPEPLHTGRGMIQRLARGIHPLLKPTAQKQPAGQRQGSGTLHGNETLYDTHEAYPRHRHGTKFLSREIQRLRAFALLIPSQTAI
jgi:hypothetical protein